MCDRRTGGQRPVARGEYETDLIVRAVEKGFIDHVAHMVVTVLLDWDDKTSVARFKKGLGIACRGREKLMEAMDGDPSVA